MVEQRSYEPKVAGSIPAVSISIETECVNTDHNYLTLDP